MAMNKNRLFSKKLFTALYKAKKNKKGHPLALHAWGGYPRTWLDGDPNLLIISITIGVKYFFTPTPALVFQGVQSLVNISA